MTSPHLNNILNQPVVPPPPGQVSNLVNPPSNACVIRIAVGICLPLVVFFAVLRIYAKLRLMKTRTYDDFTWGLGLIATVIYISVTIAATTEGVYGLHFWDVKVGQYTKEQILLTVLSESWYAPCIWLIKLSLFVFYVQVFGVLSWLRYGAYAGMVLTGLFYCVTTIIIIVFCGPKSGHSQLSYLNGISSPRCFEARKVLIAQATINVISDLYIVGLPMPAVWSLHMPLRKKLGVAIMIFTGMIACIASVFGLVYRVKINQSIDITRDVVPVWAATVIEMSAGIIVCCMPTVNVVINRTVSSFKSRFPSPDPSLLPVHGPMTPQEDQGIIKDSGLGSTLANSSNSGHIWTSDEESPAWQASNNSSHDWQETSVSYPLKIIHKGPGPEQVKF